MSHLKRKQYKALMQPLQLELTAMAQAVQHSGERVLVLFEGRDTAGKGGAIQAIAEHLNPRQCRVVALPKPTDREATQWYFQRHIAHLPAAGEIVLMDRSWYNRAGVERVMGYCSDAEYHTFLRQTPLFEQLLVDDGIRLFKYWLCVDQAQQEKRFAERLHDPLKGWKLSPVDLKSRSQYADYTRAREAMLEATHRDYAPWTLVDFNDQKRGRLTLIRHLLDQLPETRLHEPDLDLPPLKQKLHKEKFGLLQPIPSYEAGSGD
ncbi:polyphosphate kinase 2 [Xanthomonas sontii]|uniref:polyphosphate kinase 2 n=1 Tax=Xanthomonas TaxID=338 RepID=UPI0011E4A24E|nr:MULTISPECIES: polyphosphate kinase 2 [Xanthomonas]KAB7763104.1 polyphosphate kinase 2 [Xanthomonas sp. LMG 12462]MDQ7758240.1 polyphosphate kinase 2 [Xanthomonas sontii]TYD35756.1 polyphosphate kinase 2 [Xanthomonas sontii]UZK08278.1 polyphosphate kinase 2 [Xanthomonas sontii]